MVETQAEVVRTLSCKEQGEAAEAAFLTRALSLGLWVSRPWGDSTPYDAIVQGRRGLHKVQVKSVWARRRRGGGSYQAMACHGNRRKRAYRRGDVDFVAVLLARENAWYIIPARELRGRKTLRLGSRRRASPLDRYREAWDLLR